MLWFCHWVAVAISAIVAPSFRRRNSRTKLLLRAARFPLRLGFPFGSSLVPFLGRLRGGLCCFGVLSCTIRFQDGFVRGAFCTGYVCAHRHFPFSRLIRA